MDELAGVLFEVQVVEANALRLAVGDDVEVAALRYRVLILRYLVGLRQVGVEIMFAVEARAVLYFAVEAEAHFHGEVYRVVVDDRKRAGDGEAYRADVRVRRRADVVGRASAEELRLRFKLEVYFKSDDYFSFHLKYLLFNRLGRTRGFFYHGGAGEQLSVAEARR